MQPSTSRFPASSDSPEPAWKGIAAGALIVLAAVVVYFNSLKVPFLFDDVPTIVENHTIRHFGDALFPSNDLGHTANGRPMVNLSLAVNYAIGQLNPRGYHVVNIAIHALGGLALFGVVRRALQRTSLAAPALPVAACVALLWTVHPLQTEAVTYIVQRSESLVALFYLGTLYSFIRGADARTPAAWWTATAILCALGMATKEVMVSAPVIVFLYDRTFVAGSFRAAWRERWGVHLVLAATWGLLAALVISSGGRGGTAGFGLSMPWHAYAWKQCEAIVHYLRLALWPSPLVFDYGGSVLVAHKRDVLPHLLLLAALGAGTLVALKRRPALGFLGAAFFAILAPSSSIVPIADTMFEHRLYLPLAVPAVLAVLGLQRWLGNRAFAVCAVLAVALGCMTIQRNRDYRSEVALWTDTVAKRPNNVRAHYTLGSALFEAGRAPEAIAQYETALALEPDSAPTHTNFGNALVKLGRVREGAAHYEAALRIDPRSADAHNNLANALVRLGRAREAQAHYEEALRLRPAFADAHNNLGNVFAQRGDFAAARQHYEAALALRPDLADAHTNLGNVLAQSGRAADALAHYDAALRFRPEFVDAHFNRGVALSELRRWAEAAAEFETVLRLQSGHAGARENLELARLHLEISGGTK